MFNFITLVSYLFTIPKNDNKMNNLSFDHYYTQNHRALKNFAFTLTRNEFDAEDLVQESLLKLCKAFSRFDPTKSFKSWAFTVLKNTFITGYNRKKKRQQVNAPLADLNHAVADSHKVVNKAYSNLEIQTIKEQIRTLSEKSRVPFILFLEGYQYCEISEKLDIPLGTVKSRINYARKKLQESLVEHS